MKIATRLGIVALLSLPLCLASSAFAQSDAFVGTWVLNAAKSKPPAGSPPASVTLVVTDVGGGKYKQVSDSAAGGASVHSEITFAVDGKDYSPVITPLQPGMPAIAQSVEKVNESTYKTSIKVGGQIIATTQSEVSGDGRTLTLTNTGLGDFAAMSSTYVLDRQK